MRRYRRSAGSLKGCTYIEGEVRRYFAPAVVVVARVVSLIG
jgi:hypothetical protein